MQPQPWIARPTWGASRAVPVAGSRSARVASRLGLRFFDVMWRTIGNMGHLYARIDEGRHQGIPIVIIEPGEDFRATSPFDMFNAYPRKTRRLRDPGYRDAKRTFARLARQGLLPPSVAPPIRAAVPRKHA